MPWMIFYIFLYFFKAYGYVLEENLEEKDDKENNIDDKLPSFLKNITCMKMSTTSIIPFS